MIELVNLSKEFRTREKTVKAVKNANVKIKEGEIFGFIGYSGAGKSTLIRCINLLERPTSGKVLYEDKNLVELSEKELRKTRKEMGMIFQQFNLLSSLTVFDNVAFNLRDSKLSKDEIEKRVLELLDLVSISDKKDSYPSQLSGGQKQRVAIARALANNPKILLCDEATSALDPQTTSQILDLLEELNKELGITIIIITHEMHVIKKICDRVAIMDNGEISEINNVYDVFANPKTDISKRFVNSTSNKPHIINLIKENRKAFGLESNDKVLNLDFYGSNTSDSVISTISRKYNLDCNIIYGDVDMIKDKILGQLIISLNGDEENINKAKEYLKENNIKWEVIQ